MRVRHATQAAPGRACNEDSVVVHENLVGVLDGVTAPEGLDTGCRHTPTWYVERLSARLADAHAEARTASLAQILARAIELVRHDHGPDCDLSHPGTHGAAVALLRDHRGALDYLVLGDAYVVLDQGDDVEAVTDGRYTRAVADIRRRALSDAPIIGSVGQLDRVRQATLERRKLMNRDDGYWIAAAYPAAAHHAVTGTAKLAGAHAVRRAALLTDGAADLVDRFGVLDWPQLLNIAEIQGPDEVIRTVRRAELQDPDGTTQPRYKHHDDATIALCTFNGSDP